MNKIRKRKLYTCRDCRQFSTKEWHEKKPNFCGDCGSSKIMIDCRDRRDKLLNICAAFIEENELEDNPIEYDLAVRDGHSLLTDIAASLMSEEEWNAGYNTDMEGQG